MDSAVRKMLAWSIQIKNSEVKDRQKQNTEGKKMTKIKRKWTLHNDVPFFITSPAAIKLSVLKSHQKAYHIKFVDIGISYFSSVMLLYVDPSGCAV
jgi:hypothetical protein